ncbi:MAG: metalloregulator ArsR/SmtB family transcription factor [Thiomicrorhabdus sp.]|nr:metalloregulator ArsR/SmtB family transcription factor [Thiomicrorhabdus sp.]
MTLEDITQSFKALSDPIRLRIVFQLMNKESLCVCEIVAALALNQSTVSRHLAYLKNSGLVKSWREGVWMHYALRTENLHGIDLEKFKSNLTITDEINKDLKNIADKNSNCVIK